MGILVCQVMLVAKDMIIYIHKSGILNPWLSDFIFSFADQMKVANHTLPGRLFSLTVVTSPIQYVNFESHGDKSEPVAIFCLGSSLTNFHIAMHTIKNWTVVKASE